MFEVFYFVRYVLNVAKWHTGKMGHPTRYFGTNTLKMGQ